MQDVTEISHEFQTLGPPPKTKRRCLATHLTGAVICALLGAVVGAAVNEAVRQERPGFVDSLQDASVADTVVPLSGGRLFAGGPGESVLISSVGRQPQRNVLLTTMRTAETFELSFDFTPHESGSCNECRNILHVGHNDLLKLPALSLCPGNTRLMVELTDGDMYIFYSCDYYYATYLLIKSTISSSESWAMYLKVYINGRYVWGDGSFSSKAVGQRYEPVWFSDPWHSAANVTVANLVYTPLYECGPIV